MARTATGTHRRRLGEPAQGRRRSTASAVIRFAMVGAVVQVVYLGSFSALLATSITYFSALLVAQVITITVAFPAYRVHVFEATGPWRAQLGRFAGIWWAGATASLVGVPLLVELLQLSPFLAQVVMVVCVAGLSFVAHRRITFQRSTVQTPSSFAHVALLSSGSGQGSRQ
jgi:putative flippase GtrA